MTEPFQLPKDGNIYTEAIFSRCRQLISYGIWSGIQQSRLQSWIANFRTQEERYFAALVLDLLVYRSDDQTVSLLRQLLSRVIPDHARISRLSAAVRMSYHNLRSNSVDPRVRIVPVIPPRSSPTKSGPVIARHLKRALRISERWVIYPEQVDAVLPSVDAIIFIDDFLGTGDQFSEFLFDTNLADYVGTSCFIYGCLAAHRHGIDSLQKMFPKLHIAAVERLGSSHALFHSDSGTFPDGENSAEDAKSFYYSLLSDRGINIIGPDRRGYGHFEIAYAFEHSVPDNSLPILWWDGGESWRPLFDR